MNSIYLVNTSELDDEMRCKLEGSIDVLPDDVQKKIVCTKNIDLRRNRLIAWHLLYRWYKKQGWRLEIYRGVAGKPYAENSCCFNYSHSGSRVAVGICEQNIGVDLETKKLPNLEWIEERIRNLGFTWESPVERNKEEYMSSLWSAYESYVKYVGNSCWIPYPYNEGVPLEQIHSRDYILSYCGKETMKIEPLTIRRNGNDLYLCGSARDSLFRL